MNKKKNTEEKVVKMSEKEIDNNLIGSFPASDPPAWTLGLDPCKPKKPKEEN
jgi:hypothetical protein